jgi:hypothetical protein
VDKLLEKSVIIQKPLYPQSINRKTVRVNATRTQAISHRIIYKNKMLQILPPKLPFSNNNSNS